VSRSLERDQAIEIVAMVLGWFLLFGGYVLIQVRRGVWTDVDVSRREHRPHMYLVTLGIGAAAVTALWLSGYPAPVLRGMGSAVGLLAAAAIINRWIKVSLHAAFGVYAVGVVVSAAGPPLLWLSVIPLVVGWSRVAMGRHTAQEVLLGLVCGSIASIALVG
jgi:hypothetical protein